MGNKSRRRNREQSSEVVAGDRELWLLSDMSMNQSRMVQSNLWQETTSLWDTPAVHLCAAQHHKQLGSGGLDLLKLSGEKWVSILQLQWQRRPNAPLFPSLLLTRLNLSPLSLSHASVRFPSVHTLKRFPGGCVPLHPESAAQQSCSTGVPRDTHHIPTLPRQEMCKDSGTVQSTT